MKAMCKGYVENDQLIAMVVPKSKGEFNNNLKIQRRHVLEKTRGFLYKWKQNSI